MANRTFKVYGQAYAASGDVSVVMTVGGTEVFNGAVNDSTTVREGAPSVRNHLWTYTLDENTTGNLAVSVAVSGGELCMADTEHNLAKNQYVPDTWFDNEAEGSWSANDQTYLATNIGQTALDAQQAGLHAKLVAGTATADDLNDVLTANNKKPDTDTYKVANDTRTNLQIDGDASADRVAGASTDHDKAFWTVVVQDGQTFTYDWDFDPYADAV